MLNLAITLLSPRLAAADDADEGFLGKLALRLRDELGCNRALRGPSRRDLDEPAIGRAGHPELAGTSLLWPSIHRG